VDDERSVGHDPPARAKPLGAGRIRRLAARYSGVREHVGRERRRSLSATTAAIDIQTAGDPVMLRRLERMSARIGRTTEIQQAKASHSNRKLRDVATELVHGASDGERATLDHAG
jgi:hypothetical protein